MEYEGGFQGRTNKLVDGCYSLWQGGVFPLLRSSAALTQINADAKWDFDREALKEYVLTSGQNPRGGMRDKPEKWVWVICWTRT
jgi:protein farnesyltransferase subunit beta